MDIGQAEKGGEEYGWDQSQDWGGSWDATYNMNAVGKGKGKGKCWNCGEAGRLRKDCPKPKGFGKGASSGKGFQPPKGSGKGYGNSGVNKGKGKGYSYRGMWNAAPARKGGYQGYCWNCGEIGHKRGECKKVLQAVGDGEPSGKAKPDSKGENQVCIGGSTIWISPVMVKEPVELKNRFGVLGEEYEERDAPEIPDPPPGVGFQRKKAKMPRVQKWSKPLKKKSDHRGIR